MNHLSTPLRLAFGVQLRPALMSGVSPAELLFFTFGRVSLAEKLRDVNAMHSGIAELSTLVSRPVISMCGRKSENNP